MTTITQFFQPPTAPFQFQPTLDGKPYTATINWLLFGQRYYIALHALDGTLIFNQPLIGSPTGLAMNSLSWVNGITTVTTVSPHGYKIGETVALTISDCDPEVYNGRFLALITSPIGFTYPLNPGAVFSVDPGYTLGKVSYDINLAGGYFLSSTLVYRQDSAQFEVRP